jgi:O-methyltransferase
MVVMLRIYFFLRKTLRRINLDFVVLKLPRDFAQDGLTTSRLRPFENDQKYKLAKMNVVNSIGSDYGIDWRTHTFLWAIKTSLKKGCSSVELGTGKGWMALFALTYHGQDLSEHKIFLFDRFISNNVDPITGEVGHGSDEHYADSLEEVCERFSYFSENVEFIRGDLPNSILNITTGPISFIHVDLNAAEPEVASLEILYPELIQGGIVLLDDFGQPEYVESNRAMIEFAESKNLEILWLPTGQGLMIKR